MRLFYFDLFETHRGRIAFTLLVSVCLGAVAWVAAHTYQLEFGPGFRTASRYEGGGTAIAVFWLLFIPAVSLPYIPLWILIEDRWVAHPIKYEVVHWLPLTVERRKER